MLCHDQRFSKHSNGLFHGACVAGKFWKCCIGQAVSGEAEEWATIQRSIKLEDV